MRGPSESAMRDDERNDELPRACESLSICLIDARRITVQMEVRDGDESSFSHSIVNHKIIRGI